MRRLTGYFVAALVSCALATAISQRTANAQAVLSADEGGALATPGARLKIGRGDDYVPSKIDAKVLFDELKNSMKKRRDFAWGIVDQALQPQQITLLDGVTKVNVPLWQTWYEGRPTGKDGNQEINSLFALYFKNLKPVLDADPNADLKPVIDATLKEFSTKDLSSSLTNKNLSSALHQHAESAAAGKQLGQGTTMFSPSFVEHAMKEARGVDTCKYDVATADQDPPSPDQFSHCMKEFPRSAVMIKTSWRPLGDSIPNHNTDGPAMKALLDEGTWPAIPGTSQHPTKTVPLVNPDRSEVYTNITAQGQEWALTGIHFVTKDVREWVWVSLWWDPKPNQDFGADRPDPTKLKNVNAGVWKNYKMCVNSSFEEGDPKPWTDYTGPQATLGTSIKAVYDAIEDHIKNGARTAVGQWPGLTLPNALGPWPAPHNVSTSWCSNPNIETHAANGRTSCIGCHQIAFTKNEARSDATGSETQARFFHTMVGDYPQFGRSRVRKNFPAEFSWSFVLEFGGDEGAIKEGMKAAKFNWPAN